MRAFEIFVGEKAGSPARDVLDVFVNGANVTARAFQPDPIPVLCDMARAIATLGCAPRGKALVRFYDEPWELCIERLGGLASLSVYRTGAQPEVVVYDARVPFADVVAGARDAVHGAISSAAAAHAFELREACARLDDCEVSEDEPASPDSEPVPVSVELERDVPISFAADFSLRVNDVPAEAAIERADLHGLLFRGKVRAIVRGRAIELGEAFPFLFAERLLSVMQRVLDAFEQGRPLHFREAAGNVGFGARLGPSGEVALVLGSHTFPSLTVSDAVFAAITFGKSLVRAIVRRDKSQSHNLRLVAFRRAVRETQARLQEACRSDSKTNPRPESYRAYAGAVPAREVPALPHTGLGARLRYVPRWRALVPGIDLRSTFLCGDRLVVGAAHETFCLDRTSGEVLWRAPTRRASAVPTPDGIARLQSDGNLSVHDLVTGEVRTRAKLRPRTAGPTAGAVVNTAGLPKLLVVTEGERHLVAIDLLTGEARWRSAWGNGSACA